MEGRDTSLALLSMVPRHQWGGALCGLLGSGLLQSDPRPALGVNLGVVGLGLRAGGSVG